MYGLTESSIIEPLERDQRLYERVADKILALIKDDTWRSGDRLPTERELAEAFNVSRTVIREAVKVLEAQGILEMTTGSGIYVRSPDSGLVSRSLQTCLQLLDTDDVTWQLAEVRRILEIAIAALAAARATPEQRTQLRKICQEMRAGPGSTENLAKLDLRFHMLLAEATQNELFGVLLAPLMEQMANLFHKIWADYGTRPVELVFQRHEAILAAVEQSNPDAARQAMTEHMEYFFTVLEESSEKTNFVTF